MSDIFGSIIGDAAANFALFSQSGRSIGNIVPDVVIDEMNRDTGVLTQHPVETGTPVSDHYYTMGPLYEVRCGWSDASPQGGPGYIDDVYRQLQKLMATHKPFDVTSGKRQYTNMMFLSLAVRTDIESEYALMVSAVMQKCIMVDVSTGSAGATPANTNGASSVGNVNDPTGGLAAAHAAAEGRTVDAAGNVTFPNRITPGGTITLQQVAAAGGVP